MKVIVLTDNEYELLQAILNSDVFATDYCCDVIGEACSEILKHPPIPEGLSDEEAAELEGKQFDEGQEINNGLFEALGRAYEQPAQPEEEV